VLARSRALPGALLLASVVFSPAASQAQTAPVGSARLAPPPPTASRREVRNYASAIAIQVDNYWKAQAPTLNFIYTTPAIQFTTNGDEDGACDGTMMFDSDSDTVCLDLKSYPDDEDDSFVENIQDGQPGIIAYSIGHEWGHHIQRQRHQESVRDVDINIELQADCYSGMFMKAFATTASFTAKDFRDVLDDARHTGDDPTAPRSERDHGTPKQRTDAVRRGYEGLPPAACEPLRTKTPDNS
jgi:uncharacterized protein